MLQIVLIAVLLLSLLSGLTTLIGVALALRFKRNVKGIVIGIGFSAGIMLLISFFDLIPESINSTGIVTEPTKEVVPSIKEKPPERMSRGRGRRWGWVRGR